MPAFKKRWFLLTFLVICFALFGISRFFTILNPSEVKASSDTIPASGKAALAAFVFTQTPEVLPKPTQNEPTLAAVTPADPSLDVFIHQVANGQAGVVRGLFVQNLLALRILQQPINDPGYVAREEGTATQYFRAGLSGTVGLLAHNYLSGQLFFNLTKGQDLVLIFGDGKAEKYQVSEINDFERLTRSDMNSNFLELSTNQTTTATQVFARYYQKNHALTLQTCIARDGVADWGVRFILANPTTN
jgi:hypothetical protein